jgi:hypothetical protein
MADHDIRQQAVLYMEKNPQANASELAEFLVPRMAPTVDRYNSLTKAAHEEQAAAAKERQRVVDEVNAMQERVNAEVKQLRSGTPLKKKPTAAEMRAALRSKK